MLTLLALHSRSMQQTCEANEAVKTAIKDETLAAHGRMAELMVG